MSFRTRTIVSIGLALVLLIILCLLAAHLPKNQTSVASAAASAGSGEDGDASILGAGSTTPLVSAGGIDFEVVTTPAQQEQGLGDRPSIPDNYAMLFVFPKPATYGFWMKDMDESIDMIWLDNSDTIVSINSSVSPDTYPNVFYPPSPVKYVLETRAGFAQAKGWKIGTTVMLPPLSS